jgi:hypothetical protein
MAKLPELRVAGPLLLDGPLELQLRLSHTWTKEQVGLIAPLVGAFVRAGSLGAFGPRSGAGPSRLVMTMATAPEDRVFTYDLRATAIDRRSFQFLRHMLSRPDLGSATLTGLDVMTAVAAPWVVLAPVDDENEADLYPAPRDRYGFRVEWVEDVAPSKSRRVLVEFRDELDRDDFEHLEEPVSAWNALLEAGAFALPYGLPDATDNVPGFTSVHDAFTAEIGVSVYQGSEIGFDCLLNLLDAVSVAPSTIDGVAIE